MGNNILQILIEEVIHISPINKPPKLSILWSLLILCMICKLGQVYWTYIITWILENQLNKCHLSEEATIFADMDVLQQDVCTTCSTGWSFAVLRRCPELLLFFCILFERQSTTLVLLPNETNTYPGMRVWCSFRTAVANSPWNRGVKHAWGSASSPWTGDTERAVACCQRAEKSLNEALPHVENKKSWVLVVKFLLLSGEMKWAQSLEKCCEVIFVKTYVLWKVCLSFNCAIYLMMGKLMNKMCTSMKLSEDVDRLKRHLSGFEYLPSGR